MQLNTGKPVHDYVTESKLGGFYFTVTRNLFSNRLRKRLLLFLYAFSPVKFKNDFLRSDEKRKSDTKMKWTRDMKLTTFFIGK